MRPVLFGAKIWISLIILAVTGLVPRASPLAVEPESPLKAVSLLQKEHVARLENLNRLHQLCGSPPENATCIGEALAPRTQINAIYEEPDGTAPFGYFLVTYSPGIGAHAAYLSLVDGGLSLQPFEPDIYDEDWGYGPHFHQTLHGQSGAWYQVTVPNSARPTGWIELEDPSIVAFAAGDLIRMKATNDVHMILEVAKDYAEIRPMQEADMWCDLGEAPPIEPFTPVTLPLSSLYDDQKRLRFTHAYTRGC
ncbi:MAG: hypothetical protein AAGC79_14210 [Pseudomonadota bacterium]